MFTVRAMVFSLVVLVAFVLVYPTLGSYLETRAEVEQLRDARDAALAENADLEADLKRWDDDAYVVAQARERLSFVMPGETAFRVVDPEVVVDTAPDGAPVVEASGGATRPWYATVWESVEMAGDLDVDAGASGEPMDGSTAPGTPPVAPGPGTEPTG
ncbi:septum formation initiator family protein [Cellulomonas sp. Sa3CUA2]|uniref:Septum formation initiator family protein n=1 Tax=Cellulomonas avistercoris TaxID=2762242 RepID=A0ABR8QFM8_9CELL|nr:septum formation initiator family protein [Cellulomonas avistercoris]MBD7919234.1 septum formation initiator family protein [Cellulomonas avistercoris]